MDAKHRTLVCSCTPENLESPGLVLAHHPGMTARVAARGRPPHALMISWRCSPRPSMPSVTTSPTLRNFGGFMPAPTPGGVPVVMMSPGSSCRHVKPKAMHCAMVKIMVGVEPVWQRLPLTSSHIDSFCTLGTSSLVTSHGPTGPKVSCDLPLVHCPPRSVWK